MTLSPADGVIPGMSAKRTTRHELKVPLSEIVSHLRGGYDIPKTAAIQLSDHTVNASRVDIGEGAFLVFVWEESGKVHQVRLAPAPE